MPETCCVFLFEYEREIFGFRTLFPWNLLIYINKEFNACWIDLLAIFKLKLGFMDF